MANILPSLGVNSPISADLMYSFYDNKAITPRIRDALQKKEDAANAGSDNSASNSASSTSTSNSSSASKNPAVKLDILDEVMRMSRASNTAKLEDLKSRVKPSKEVEDIETRLAEEAKAKEDAKKAETTDTVQTEAAAGNP